MSAPSIKKDDLDSAYDIAEAGQMHNASAWLCRKTGTIYYRGEGLEEFGTQLPKAIEDSDQFVHLPSKHDLGLASYLVFRFAREELPEIQDEVDEIFSRKGAYRRFRALLERRGDVQRWYDFQNRERDLALTNWCEELGVTVGK